MNYFPDKPWNIGDEFENETTGVTYQFDGTKWVATGDSDPLVEYLPLTGGTLEEPGDLQVKGDFKTLSVDSGQSSNLLLKHNGSTKVYVGGSAFTVQEQGIFNKGALLKDNVTIDRSSGYALDIKRGDDIRARIHSDGTFTTQRTEFSSNHLVTKNFTDSNYLSLTNGGQLTGDVQFQDDTKLQMGGTYNNNIIDENAGFTDNSLVPTLGYVKHAINSLGVGGGNPTLTPPKFLQSNSGWENLYRDGLFGMQDSSGNNTLRFEDARAIWWTVKDVESNLPFIHSQGTDWTAFFPGPLYIMKNGVVHAQVTQGVSASQFVVMDGALRSLGIYYIGWQDSSILVPTDGYIAIGQGSQYEIYIPSMMKL